MCQRNLKNVTVFPICHEFTISGVIQPLDSGPSSVHNHPPPSLDSLWLNDYPLLNDLIHFYEVVYQSVLFLLMSTSVSRFSIHDAEQKNGMKHVNVETPNIRRSGVTGRLRFHKAASSKKRPQLSSELGAGMCFVNESQC